MKIEYSKHWIRKHKKKKKDITAYTIEYAVKNSEIIRDKHWSDAFNALAEIPPSGRGLKVVYKRVKGKIFIQEFHLNKLL